MCKDKYIKNLPIMEVGTKQTDSSTWKDIVRSLEMVNDGFGWRVGNGEDISF